MKHKVYSENCFNLLSTLLKYPDFAKNVHFQCRQTNERGPLELDKLQHLAAFIKQDEVF